MGWIYRQIIRPTLFAQESEAIHNRTLKFLGAASRHSLACDLLASCFEAPALPVEVFGLRFPNPVGLAAGMDKYGTALPVWSSLGFGFAELGGVTWHPQPGNPEPRMFRAPAERALVNRMGFNNPGAEELARTLENWRRLQRWPSHPVGINLGKSKVTPLAEAAADYAKSFRALRTLADFFVINVSSPNTPNLRALQDRTSLDEILAAVQELNQSPPTAAPAVSAPTNTAAAPIAPVRKPILVKVAPDLSFEALDEILELVGPRSLAGIVATNTTIARPETSNEHSRRTFAETGGLSGQPLRARSTEVIRHLHRRSGGTVPIIGVGGIFDDADAWEKILAGASLVQVYTGMVYEGPVIARQLVHGLQARLATAGRRTVRDAVGGV